MPQNTPKLTLLITGSRDFADKYHVRAWLQHLLAYLKTKGTLPEDVLLVHGDAKGADRTFETAARALGITTLPCPADWDTYGKRAGTLRNEQMLDMFSYDLVYGCPLPGSIGTWHMLRIASKAGLRCRLRHPKTGKVQAFHWSMEESYK